MLHLSREWLSERRFPGFKAWFLGIGAIASLAGVLSWIAFARFDGRLFDLTRTVFFPTLLLATLMIVTAQILAVALSVSWKAAAAGVSRWMPWVLLAPVANILYAALTHAVQPLHWPLAAPIKVVLAIATVGWAPLGFVNLGTALVWTLLLLVTGLTVWHWTHAVKRTALTVLVLHLMCSVVLLVPSLTSWTQISQFTWASSSFPLTALTRASVAAVHGSYWWRTVSERFLGLGGSEGEAAIQSFFVMQLFLLVSGLLVWRLRRESALSWREFVEWLRISRLTWVLGPLFFGGLLAWQHRADLVWTWPTWVAILGALCVVGWLWLAMRWQNDLTDVSQDERSGRLSPLIEGRISIHELEDWRWLAQIMGLIGAWLLGWPCFAMALVWSLVYWFLDDALFHAKALWPWNQLLLGISGLAWIWFGWVFMSQSGAIQPLGAGGMTTLLLVSAGFAGEKTWPAMWQGLVFPVWTRFIPLGIGLFSLWLAFGSWFLLLICLIFLAALAFFRLFAEGSEALLRWLVFAFWILAGCALLAGS